VSAIIIRGPLAVGKTTIGRMLADQLGGRYVSFDQIMDESELDQVEEGGGIALASFLKGNALAIAQVRDALDAGVTVVFDGCFYHLGQLEDLVASLPGGAEVFTLKAPLETCISRDRERERSYGVDAAAAVHWMVSQFDYGTCIDTEEKTAEQVVAEICEGIASHA
jgi:predicted kinase